MNLQNTLTSMTDVRPRNSNLVESSADNIRIHYKLYNNNPVPIEVKFNTNRVTPILNNPEDYEVCIEYCHLSEYFSTNPRNRLVFSTDAPVLGELAYGSKNITDKIIGYAPFEIVTPDGVNYFKQVNYAPEQYRWFDMISNYPLKELNIYVFTEIQGELQPLFLTNPEEIGFNILFRKKKGLLR